jgi:hypothetical protein
MTDPKDEYRKTRNALLIGLAVMLAAFAVAAYIIKYVPVQQ